jgi:peptide/nickel transport system ATP-binding protein
MRRRRGSDLAMIFQDPMTSLNPVFTVGDQICEMLRQHQDLDRSEARREALSLLDLVGIPEPGRRIDQYPHEFSGGMRQRIVIAIAMANRPRLVIADEPTTALDVTIQAQVMEVMREVQREVGSALILITHDLGLVAGTADRVQVMYGGRILESGPTDRIFAEGASPYTMGLLRSLPRLERDGDAPLFSIPGAPPSAIFRPHGCPFRPRCGYATEMCGDDLPPFVEVSVGHSVRCHHLDRVVAEQQERQSENGAASLRSGLETHFPVRAGLFRRQVGTVYAVDGIDLEVRSGETVGVVGESGAARPRWAGRSCAWWSRPGERCCSRVRI